MQALIFTFAALARFGGSGKHSAHIQPALHRLQKPELTKQQLDRLSVPDLIFCPGIHKPPGGAH